MYYQGMQMRRRTFRHRKTLTLFLGLTGIDGLCRLRVSTPGVGRISRQKFFQNTIGEANYALAA